LILLILISNRSSRAIPCAAKVVYLLLSNRRLSNADRFNKKQARRQKKKLFKISRAAPTALFDLALFAAHFRRVPTRYAPYVGFLATTSANLTEFYSAPSDARERLRRDAFAIK